MLPALRKVAARAAQVSLRLTAWLVRFVRRNDGVFVPTEPAVLCKHPCIQTVVTAVTRYEKNEGFDCSDIGKFACRMNAPEYMLHVCRIHLTVDMLLVRRPLLLSCSGKYFDCGVHDRQSNEVAALEQAGGLFAVVRFVYSTIVLRHRCNGSHIHTYVLTPPPTSLLRRLGH